MVRVDGLRFLARVKIEDYEDLESWNKVGLCRPLSDKGLDKLYGRWSPEMNRTLREKERKTVSSNY